MANNDPRIKASENSPYMKAHAARLARLGRDVRPVDVTQIPRLATVLPESRATNDALLQEHIAGQADNPYSLTNAVRSGWGWHLPPGLGPTKEQLVNGTAPKRP